MASGVIELTADEIIREIENLPEGEKKKLFSFLYEKLNAFSSKSFDFWNNEEDSIYDDL